MAGAIMEKVWGLFGLDSAEDAEDEEVDNYDEEEIEEEDGEQEEKKSWIRRNKVVNMPQVQQVKMVISQPTTFEQAANICDLLKQKRSIVVNLEYVNKDVARKISNSIVLIAPFNYDIENEMARDEIKNKLSVSWLRNGN